jgi:hypothetical protein
VSYLAPDFEIHDHVSAEGAVDADPDALSDNTRRIGDAFEQVLDVYPSWESALASIGVDEPRAQAS